MIIRDLDERWKCAQTIWQNLLSCALAFAGVAALVCTTDIFRSILWFVPGKLYTLSGFGTHLNKDIGVFLIVFVLVRENWVSAVFKIRPLVVLGVLSYSIYLMHSVLGYFQFGLSFDITTPDLPYEIPYPSSNEAYFWLLYMPAVIGVSFLTYRFVELPFLQRGRRLRWTA